MSRRRAARGEAKAAAGADAAYVRRHIVFPIAVVLALLGAGVIVLVSSMLPDRLLDVPDAELLAIAEESPEARAFVYRYPIASSTVDRSGRAAVDYRAGPARLRLFFGEGPRVTGALLDCPGRAPVETNVVDAARAGCS